MTYSNDDHAAATEAIINAQGDRMVSLDSTHGPEFEELVRTIQAHDRYAAIEVNLRAIESAAPENTGRRRHRAQSIAARVDLAARYGRSLARRARMADGPQPSPGPNRAQRRARKRIR